MDTLLEQELLDQLTDDADSVVMDSEFLKEAERTHLWNKNLSYGSSEAITIFVPKTYREGDSGVHFEEVWNRHVVKGINKVHSDSVQQLTTNANIVFALCPVSTSSLASLTTAASCFGGVPLETTNIEHNGCMYHVASSPLPDLRPAKWQLWNLKTCYLAHETIELQFLGCGLIDQFEQTLTVVVSTTELDRTPLAANQKMGWHGNGTKVSIVIPPVKTRTNMMLWLSMFDNRLRHPIISTTLPLWCLVVQPNMNMHTNPIIYDISPKTGKAHQELTIFGSGFDNRVVRVTIGRYVAQVIKCIDTYVRCFVPNGSGKQTVWVANGNVYTRFDSFVYESLGAKGEAATSGTMSAQTDKNPLG